MMKKLSLLIVLLGCGVGNIRSWGFLTHRIINQNACLALPKPLFEFYKKHIQYLIDHATDPDNRRYMVENEACKHFIDCDYYEKSAPLDTIFKNYDDAVCKYSEDTVLKHGIVPWQCNRMVYWLRNAFLEKDLTKILKVSADLGHYVADAHVPLHTSSNYNGQKTNQHGIHALWETRIPEVFIHDYPIFVSDVMFLPNFNLEIWKSVEESFSLVTKVLLFERLSKKEIPENEHYEYVQKGSQVIKRESTQLIRNYEQKMDDMVLLRIKKSIQMVASFWYTAYLMAGEPDLSEIENQILPVEIPLEEISNHEHR
jgi:hypothetical protein